MSSSRDQQLSPISRESVHSSSLIDWHHTTQSSSIKGSPNFFLGLFDPHHRVFVHLFVEIWKHNCVHFLNCANFTMVANAVAVSTEMDVSKASASLFFPSGASSASKTTLVHCVSKLPSEQFLWFFLKYTVVCIHWEQFAPRPSVSPTTCLRKSVLFHMIFLLLTFRASTYSSIVVCLHTPILLNCTRSPCIRKHRIGRPCCTITCLSSLYRKSC